MQKVSTKQEHYKISQIQDKHNKTSKRMKTIATIVLAATALPTFAQTITGRFDFGDTYRSSLSIPKEFSYNGDPHLVIYDSNDKNTIHIYNDNLEMVKTIAMKESLPFSYKLTYEDQVRDVVAVNETRSEETCRYSSYEQFVEREKMVDPNFDESCFITTDLGDGTRKIKIDYSRSRYTSNEQMYYAYSSFGMQYPKGYFIDNGNSVTGYRATYTVSYSDWRPAGTREVNCSADQERIPLCNINLNQSQGRAESFFEVSQTLFNDDAAFEYVMPKFKLAAKGNSAPDNVIIGDGSEETVITTRSVVVSELKKLALAGFQVLSESGTVISDITFDSGFEGSVDLDAAFVITIGSNVYLAFDGYQDGTESTIFYKIEKTTSAIRKVKTAPGTMSVSPLVVSRGSAINITFGDANATGSDLQLVSPSGALLRSCHVPSGQTSAQIRATAPAGICFLSRLQKNKAAETRKVVVR